MLSQQLGAFIFLGLGDPCTALSAKSAPFSTQGSSACSHSTPCVTFLRAAEERQSPELRTRAQTRFTFESYIRKALTFGNCQGGKWLTQIFDQPNVNRNEGHFVISPDLVLFTRNTFVVVQSLSHVCLFVIPWTQHARLPCPPLSPGVCSESCPLSPCCSLTISSSALPLSFYLQSFPASGSFPTSWLFALSGWSIETLASTIPVNIQGWFPLELTGLLSLLSKGVTSCLQHHNSKASILRHSAFFMFQLSHPYMTTGETIALTIQTFVSAF